MRLDGRDHGLFALWAADCAERVLSCFEEKYPKDDRPRKAIEAGRAWARGEMNMGEARAAAVAAHAAARATGHAAATAHMAAHAPRAAAYAAKAVAYAGSDADEEREWQIRHLPKHLHPVAFLARGDG